MFKLLKMTINKRRPELFALSDRNTPQRFRAPWHRPADKASLSHSERGPGGLGGRGKGGVREAAGETAVRGRGGGREVPSHSELFRSIKPSV